MNLLNNIFLLLLISTINGVLSQGPFDTLEQCQDYCKDNNLCTTEKCTWYYGWFCSIDAKICNDGSICTNDSCNPLTGQCENVPSVNCDDNNPCTLDYCHFTLGCIHKTQTCDIITACNKTTDCYRGRKCETYSCNSAKICDYAPLPCSDEQPCTEYLGTCLGNPTN